MNAEAAQPLPDVPLVRCGRIVFAALDGGEWDALSRDRQTAYVDVATLVAKELGVETSTCGDDTVLAERALCIIEALHITDARAIDRIYELVQDAGGDRARTYLAARDQVPF